MPVSDLAYAWFYILSGLLFLYVVFDGFDLGIGILTLFSRDRKVQRAGMEALHGVWHANQTWLIVFAAALFAVFPMVYGVVMATLYLPVALMLLGLVARGLALEYQYFVSEKAAWVRLAFGWGSVLAAVAQGLGIGTLLLGFPLNNNQFAGGVWHWLSPLPILFGLALPVFYILLGATRLIGLTRDQVQRFCRYAAGRAAVLALGAVLVVLIYSVIQRPVWAQGWLSRPGILIGLLPLLLGASMLVPMFTSFLKFWEQYPFAWVIVSIGLLFLGMANSVFPLILPPVTTIGQAAAPRVILKITLVGFGITLPVILVYIVYMYRLFGGDPNSKE